MSHFNGTEHNRPVHFSSRESHTAGREESCPVHSTLLLPSFATACHRFIFNRAPHTMTPGAAHFAALLSCLLLSYHSSSPSSSFSSSFFAPPTLFFSFLSFLVSFDFYPTFSFFSFWLLLERGLFVDPFNFRPIRKRWSFLWIRSMTLFGLVQISVVCTITGFSRIFWSSSFE